MHMLLDGLPAATKYFMEPLQGEATINRAREDPAEADFIPHYEKGFPLGFIGSEDVRPWSGASNAGRRIINTQYGRAVEARPSSHCSVLICVDVLICL